MPYDAGLVDEQRPNLASAGDRISRVIEWGTYSGIGAHLLFIPLFVWMGVPLLAWVNVASVATWFAARYVNRQGNHALASGLITAEVVIHTVLTVMILGWDSGFHYYMVPIISFVLFSQGIPTRSTLLLSIGTGLLYVVLHLVAADNPRGLDAGLITGLELVNIVVPLSTLGLITYSFRLASIDSERRMAELAMTDTLTRLPNRRYMLEILDMQQARFDRNRTPFSLVMTDVDHFKFINDDGGHECGDQVLRDISQVFKNTLRAQDVVARWGGEEFLILLPETGAEGVEVAAEKLRQAVEDHEFKFNGTRYYVTVTLGTSVHGEGCSMDESIRRADQALYAGKSAGRNRVVAATPEQPLADPAETHELPVPADRSADKATVRSVRPSERPA